MDYPYQQSSDEVAAYDVMDLSLSHKKMLMQTNAESGVSDRDEVEGKRTTTFVNNVLSYRSEIIQKEVVHLIICTLHELSLLT